MRVLRRPRLAARPTSDGEALLGEVRAGEVVREVRGGEDQGVVGEAEHSGVVGSGGESLTVPGTERARASPYDVPYARQRGDIIPTALTPEERLERFDGEIEDLKHGFVEAVGQLQRSPEMDASFEQRWADIDQRLRNLRTDLHPDDYDKEQVTELFSTLFDIRDLLDEPSRDLDTYDQLLLGIEHVRHIVRDALDEHVSGVADDVGLVMRDLTAWLPNTSRQTLGELVGVDRRTLSRWAKQSGSPPRRLRAVARTVAVLRHNWTEDGIVGWFHRPRRDLGGRKPISLLGDPRHDEAELIMAARSGRSQYAT